MTNVAIIGTVGVPACYGGFETLAHHLVENWQDKANVSVYCSKAHYPKAQRQSHYKQARLVYLPFKANGIQSIIYDIVSIFHALTYAQTLVILGVSGCLILPFIKLFFNQRIVVNIDGLEWKRNKWNKWAKMFLKWSEKIAVKYADVIVTDNKAIQEHVMNAYGVESELIAYGGDHVITQNIAKDTETYPFLANPYHFKVCRIEPENNVHVILEAFAEMPDKQLVIVGNWERGNYGQNLLATYNKLPNIHLLAPIYDQEKLDMLRSNCLVYLHGHSAGGTNPSLVEAMYLGLPIIAFDVNYNRASTENKALYFHTKDDLKTTLNQQTITTLEQKAQKMQEIAQRRYTWEIIADKYQNLLTEPTTQVIQTKETVKSI